MRFSGIYVFASFVTFAYAFDWQGSVGGMPVTWASGCDWNGPNINSVASDGDYCGMQCLLQSGCTHFTWTDYSGGTCWLKSDSGGSAVDLPSGTNGVCGWVEHPPSGDWQYDDTAGNAYYSDACIWGDGGYLYQVSADSMLECVWMCENPAVQGCYRWEFADNTGICTFLSADTGSVASYTDNLHCGWIL
ncbi:hypothetical protein HK100_011308 [Physocladia obscura]|uniref:Apple domain-containing protein n=1 Tax=Physocladia obscura TaxID=109957 RepID=A0AAD5XH21_9FUNG|nr:hypothetical protein HK100_011308 [Physocladia obscura]